MLLKKKFLNFIKDKELIRDGDKVLVGLSGGPDSVCLLHLLYTVRDELNIKIGAAHINHQIRGEEAERDEQYSKELCESLGIQFYSLSKDVNGYAKENGISSETAGREIRYGFFKELVNNKGFTKVATAHNANDQVETILMRLMRGTGIDGLCGIPVKREDIFIRPILFMERDAIEEYCDINKLNPKIDKTNLERDYSRNKIRLDLVPYMKENFNPNLVKSINRMIDLLTEDNDFLQSTVDKNFDLYTVKEEDSLIIKKEVLELHFSILSRVIRKSLVWVSKSNSDFELKHITDVIELFEIGTGRGIHLPNELEVVNIYGDIKIGKRGKEKENPLEDLLIDKKTLKNRYEFKKFSIKFDIIKTNTKFDNNYYIKYFDYDKINDTISIRKRKNGDKIHPLGMKGTKKIKDILMDAKIPADERDSIPIVQFDEKIAWVVGLRVSDDFKVTNDTKNILRITVDRKD